MSVWYLFNKSLLTASFIALVVALSSEVNFKVVSNSLYSNGLTLLMVGNFSLDITSVIFWNGFKILIRLSMILHSSPSGTMYWTLPLIKTATIAGCCSKTCCSINNVLPHRVGQSWINLCSSSWSIYFFTEAVYFFGWLVKMLNKFFTPSNCCVHLWNSIDSLNGQLESMGQARKMFQAKLSSSMALTMFWPLSVVTLNTLDKISHSSNIDDKTCWIANAVCSLGTSSVCKYSECRTNFCESTKWTVSEI